MMTEVSSMSETEAGHYRRPSSLPPPPSERLPQLPAIFVSDTEAVQNAQKKKACRKVKKHNTVSGVTLEARRVLEHLLKRSLSQNDAPHQSDSSGDHYPRYPLSDPRATYTDSRGFHTDSRGTCSDPRAEITHQNIMERLLKKKMAELSMSEHGESEEPDYVYPHEIVRKPLSVSSQGSGKNLQQSPKPHRCSTPPVHIIRHHILDDESSTSTEDYEYTDPNEFLRRKKKSFFRRQTERLMHTFRRRKERPLDFEIESSQDVTSPHKCKKKKKGSTKLTSPFKSLKSTRSGFDAKREDSMQQEVLRTATSSPEHVTHYTDIEQFHEESLRRKCQSPLPWKKSKFAKDGHLSDGGKDKGLFDSFIRQIKKRSSFRVKRKDSTKESRCHSEENLRVRSLTHEERMLLRRYDVSYRDNGSDSEQQTVHSLREVLSHRIDQQMSPSSLAREGRTTRDSLDSVTVSRTPSGVTSQHMHMSSQFVQGAGIPSQIEEPDYDEIEDGDEIDGFLGTVCDMLPKPFQERTATEKEILYERIADQLATIADHYNMGSPNSRKSSPTEVFSAIDLLHESSGSSELEGATARAPQSRKSSDDEEKCLPEMTDTERQLAAVLRAKGDAATTSLPEVTPLVRDLVSSVSYSDFQHILGEKLGPNPGWPQVAMMFRLTQTAVQLAGMGTSVAARMKENTLKYFEDRMAGWIVKQGGWESMVEDTNSELD